MKWTYIILLIASVVIVGCTTEPINTPQQPRNVPQQSDVTLQLNNTSEQKYDPVINPTDFSVDITNKYFKIEPGKKLRYKGQTEDGLETIEVYVTNETKTVMGVKTLIVWDRVWLDGDLIEDTKDYYAQDKKGNVWYFGEDTAELIDGKIVNRNGAWLAGIENAKPGIIMPVNPQIGETYKTEYYEGNAEDKIDILALNEQLTVPYGKLNNCLKTRDYSPLEQGADEHKYHCPEVGFVVLEVGLEDNESVELVSVEYNAKPSPSTIAKEPEKLITKITEEQAKAIALKEVPGEVTDVSIEKKFGKTAFVIEVAPTSGPETDVIIGIDTGEVLGVET